MKIDLDNPNSLNLLGIRKLEVPPVFFTYCHLTLAYNLILAIEEWIQDHCKGRYYIGQANSVSEDGSVNSAVQVGFEESKEMSYFMLACPHLKYK
jgi:hypothetical protein